MISKNNQNIFKSTTNINMVYPKRTQTFSKMNLFFSRGDQKSQYFFGLVGFDGISNIVGYLMPNLFLYIQIVLFQTILFNISTQFKYQNRSISNNSV